MLNFKYDFYTIPIYMPCLYRIIKYDLKALPNSDRFPNNML